MKLIRNALILLSLGGFSLHPLEANSFQIEPGMHTTLDELAKQIAQEPYPALALYKIWKEELSSQEEFAQLCHELGIQTRLAHQQGKTAFDLCHEDEWTFLDLEQGQFYLGLDNQTVVSSEAVMDDPFLALRTKHDRKSAHHDLKQAWQKIALFDIAHPALSEPDPVTIGNKTAISRGHRRVHYPVPLQASPVSVANTETHFDFCSPHFQLDLQTQDAIERVWWQISSDPSFNLIPSNFEQIEPFTSTIRLTALTETFFNAHETYYFRVKALVNGSWSEWTAPFAFSVDKPERVTLVEFEKLGENRYEINWEREADEDPSIEYLVFGSNSLDFIPSIYTERQVNAMVDGVVTEEEPNDNLITITQEPKLEVDGTLAYYRILARQKGQLSVPSDLIHVYDEDLIQPRNVLQVVEEDGHQLIKRVLFPATYPWTETSLPRISVPCDIFENSLLRLHTAFMRAPVLPLTAIRSYQQNPHVIPEVWSLMKPYFLPENHPIKPKLDRMFSATRVILNPKTFKKAGFKRYRPGRVSRIMASSHPDLIGYFVKAFPDNDLVIRYEWQKLRHRIEGAKSIRNWIDTHNMQSVFTVPKKWIYPLPENPSPPNSNKYARKNFILIAEDMRILEHAKNEKAYRTKMNRHLLDALYTLLDDEGLYDSVYAFNIPFNKEKKIAIIDTEHHHRWPVPFHKLSKYFSKDMKNYWQYLIDNGGPKGHKTPKQVP